MDLIYITFEPLTIGSIALLLAGLGGNVFSSLTNYQATKKQNETQIQLAREAQQYDYDKWQELAAYNSPTNQMQRLRDAGLNPNLMYSQGNVGNMTQSPQARIPQIEAENPKINPMAMVQTLAAIPSMRRDNAQADLMTQNASLIKVKEDLERQKIIESEQKVINLMQQNINNQKLGKGFDLKNEWQGTLNAYQNLMLQEELKSKIQQAEQSAIKTEKDQILLDMEKTLKPYNLTTGDNIILRLLLSAFGTDINNFFKPKN